MLKPVNNITNASISVIQHFRYKEYLLFDGSKNVFRSQ